MTYHIPILPEPWVFEFIARNWTILPEEGTVISKNTGIDPFCPNERGKYIITVTNYRGLGTRGLARCHVIWFGYYKIWPKLELDHFDRDPSNDKVSNLKEVTHEDNQLNMTRSVYKDLPPGVYRSHKGRYLRANLWVKDKSIFLGDFDTIETANKVVTIARAMRSAGELVTRQTVQLKVQELNNGYEDKR